MAEPAAGLDMLPRPLTSARAVRAYLRTVQDRVVAGVDEVGRGALAGPVVAAAVILPPGPRLRGLADSKTLTPEVRERLFDLIQARALAVGTGSATPASVDEVNILRAALMAMGQAIASLGLSPEIVLVDGPFVPPLVMISRPIPRGDALVPSISAASIIAKVTRDRLMSELAMQFPAYGFERHKGYGTADHHDALRRHGPCPIHRVTFAPVRAAVIAQWQLGLPGIVEADAELSTGILPERGLME